MSFQLPHATNPFQNTPLASLVQPETNQSFYLLIQNGITGGQVVNVGSSNGYNMKIILVNLLLSQLNLILSNPNVGLVISSNSMKRWRNNIKEAEKIIKDVKSLLFMPVSGYDIGKLLLLHNKLKQHLEKIRYLCALLNSAQAIKGTAIAVQLKQMTGNLPQLPDLQFTRSPIVQDFKGFKLKFDGRICIQRICFPVMPLTVESKNGLVIRGEIQEDFNLGEVLILKKHSEVTLQIPREESFPRVTFNPILNLLEMNKTISASIVNNTMMLQTFGLLFGKYPGLVTAKSKLNVADWTEMKYHIKVTMKNDTDLPLKLKRKLTSYIQELAEKARKRVVSAEQVARVNENRLRSFKKNIKDLTRTYEKYERKKLRKINALRRAKADYFVLKNTRYHDILSASEDQKLCIPKPCSKICSNTKVCTFKSKKLVIDETKHICKAVNVEEERIEYVTRREPTWYYEQKYTKVYTGNCASGFFAAIKEYFVGCHDTFNSVPDGVIKVEYTRVWQEEVRTKVPVTKYNCETFREKVVTDSYGPPKMVCNDNGCVKVTDPNCTLETIKCINRNKIIRHTNRNSESDKYKQELILRLHNLANKMEMASMELEATNAKCTKAHEELKLARAQLRHFEYAANRSSIAVKEIKTFESTKLGYYLYTMLTNASNIQQISVSDFEFDTIIKKTKSKLPLIFNVSSFDGKSKEMSFLFNFKNVEIVLYKMMTTIVTTIFKETPHAGRKRRSIPEENNEEKRIDSETLNHCFLARKVNAYHKNIVQSLQDLIFNRKRLSRSNKADVQNLKTLRDKFGNISQFELKNNISDSSQEIKDNNTNIYQETRENATDVFQESNGNKSKEIEGSDTDSSQKMIQTCVDFLQSMLNDKVNHTLPTWSQTLIGWRAFLEVLTNESSFQDCVNTQDCVISLGETLNELYLYESDFQPAIKIKKRLNNVTIRLLELITSNFTEEESSNKLAIIDKLLHQTFDKNVLCGDQPTIIFSSPKEKIVLKNDTLMLKCVAMSDSPVTYQWIHKNTTVQKSTNSTLIITNVNSSHAGGYQCKASNRKGFVTSNVTMITINSKPEITQQSSDKRVYINDRVGLLLWCNVTGKPFPGIQWFFVSHRPNSTVTKLEIVNSTTLHYKNITEDQSGFYFCRAINKYGQVQSRKARVWVLHMTPGEPRVSVQVNVIRQCKNQQQSCPLGNNIETAKEKALFDEKLTSSLNTPQRQITDTKYQPSGDSGNAAVVSFTYKTNKPTKRNNSDSVYDPFLELFARKRRDLSQSLQELYYSMMNNSFSAATDDVTLTGDANSMTAKFLPPGCPLGQEPHSNGYMCGKNYNIYVFSTEQWQD